MLSTAIGRLRAIGLIEGVSYLVLLGIAMPLKYIFKIPQAVKVVGWAHGVLFVLFCTALALAMFKHRWKLKRAIVIFLSSLVPFGTFMIDGGLKREDEGNRQ